MAAEFYYGGRAMLVGAEKLENIPDSVEVIGCNMTGTDHLPWDEIRRRGIKVVSLKGERQFLNTVTSTAEFTMLLIQALFRNLKFSLTFQEGLPRDLYTGHTLRGKTLGIIGYGRVGRQVAKLAKAFGMRVLACDKSAFFPWGQTDLMTVLHESDVVSAHIPLEGNVDFFTYGHFALMKPTAFFVNTSRPGICAENDLLFALKGAEIAGAAVDFVDDHGLINYAKTHDNLILTPHCGGNTYEDRKKTRDFILNKIDKHFR